MVVTKHSSLIYITADWNSESFMECAHESFKYGEMSNSQRKAVITLIEKQGKDRTQIENWRPISLINVDAKIISKVIAVRVKNVLPNIIHQVMLKIVTLEKR